MQSGLNVIQKILIFLYKTTKTNQGAASLEFYAIRFGGRNGCQKKVLIELITIV